ncbi:alpha/beta hydrolase family esterase [Serratia sp. IR-2025]
MSFFSKFIFCCSVIFIMATGSSQAKVFSIEPKDMPSAPKLTGKFYNSTINNDGSERKFWAYLPADLPRNSPLVIVLHGSEMNGVSMREMTGYEFDWFADQRKFAVVYPEGYKNNWNDCRKNATFPAKVENIDDVGFIKTLISEFVQKAGVDPKRIYIFGYSNGGHMALRMALEHPDSVTAVAVVGASMPSTDDSSCPSQGKTSRIMFIDGTADPINPFNGGVVTLFGKGSRGKALSALDSAEIIAKRNGINTTPRVITFEPKLRNDPTWVKSSVWYKDNEPFVSFDAVYGGGHVIPQPIVAFPKMLGSVTSALNAPQSSLDFFGINADR